LSLAERADAASKAATDLSLKTRLIRIWQMNPADAERNLSEKEDEMILAQQLALATAAGPQPVGANQGGNNQPQQGNQPQQQQPGQGQQPQRAGAAAGG
jgi:hypothetical protein